MNTINPLLPAPHIKGLIFDLDGTLADTMPLHLAAWQAAGERYKVQITEKMVMDRAGTPTGQVIQQFNEIYNWHIDPEEFKIKKNELYNSLKVKQGKIKPIQSVYRIAHQFRHILPMAIGTGSIKKNAVMALNDMEMIGWFAEVITADDVMQHKPHPETFLKCSQAMGVPPNKCLVYEDGDMGIQAALAAGMSVIHIETLEIHHP